MDFGNGEFYRADYHLDNAKIIWCEVAHGHAFYYSEYEEEYGTDITNMRDEPVLCLMEYYEEVCNYH